MSSVSVTGKDERAESSEGEFRVVVVVVVVFNVVVVSSVTVVFSSCIIDF